MNKHTTLERQFQTLELDHILQDVKIAAAKLDIVLKKLLGKKFGAKIDRRKHTH